MSGSKLKAIAVSDLNSQVRDAVKQLQGKHSTILPSQAEITFVPRWGTVGLVSPRDQLGAHSLDELNKVASEISGKLSPLKVSPSVILHDDQVIVGFVAPDQQFKL